MHRPTTATEDPRPSPNLSSKRRRPARFWIHFSILLLVALWAQTLHRANRLHSSSLAAVGAEGRELLRIFRSRPSKRLRRSNVAPYEVGDVCLGAKLQGAKKPKCSDQMHRHMSTRNLTIVEAASIVVDEYPNCARCKTSDPNGKERYWRFDFAAPSVTSGVTHFLTSVPSKARLPPPSKDFNLTAHLVERWERNRDTEFFFEYNPSLVILPKGATKDLNLPDGEKAAYLASFRVTPANECFSYEVWQGMPREQWEAVRGIQINYIALALLRSDLSIIPGYEIVTDFFVQTGGDPTNTQDITDYRIFTRNDTLYFNINGMPVHVAPFSLISDGSDGGSDAAPDGGQILPNLYGGGFRVVLLQNLTSIWAGGFHGKNYAMFQTDEIRGNEVLVELTVSPVHTVQRILLDEFYMMNLSSIRKAQWPDRYMKRWDTPMFEKKHGKGIDVTRRRRNVAVGNESVSKAPERSFRSVDEFWFGRAVFKEFNHGGACCVAIDTRLFNGGIASEGRHLLVGIGHTKISWKPWYRRNDVSEEEKRALPHGQYVSFFYAFEPRAPYAMKAKSAYFCFGFGEGTHPYFEWAQMIKLSMNNEEFDCPRVHYVSSITEKAGDATKLIVSYGVNDCFPRMVEMDKSEIARFLVAGPK